MLLGNKVDLRAELPETAGVHPTHGERLALVCVWPEAGLGLPTRGHL